MRKAFTVYIMASHKKGGCLSFLNFYFFFNQNKRTCFSLLLIIQQKVKAETLACYILSWCEVHLFQFAPLEMMTVLSSLSSPGQRFDPGSVSLFQLCQFLLQHVGFLPQARWVLHLSIQQTAKRPGEHATQIIMAHIQEIVVLPGI